MENAMEIPAQFNEGQYKVIFELMVEPLILTVTEACSGRRDVAEQLIIRANKKQIGGDEFLRIFGRSHDVLMETLNGLTKLYNREDLLDSTFGKNTLYLEIRRDMINHMIARILDQQYSGSASVHAMQEMRNLVLAWSRSKRLGSYEGRGLYDATIAVAKRRHKIPNACREGYSSLNPDISHLDLSGMDLSNLPDVKQMQLINCNLSHCNFSNTHLSRANFSNSNLTHANFTGCHMIGEEVSFANADCTGAIFIGVEMERGISWSRMTGGESLKMEIIARGGLNVDKAIFSAAPTPPRVLASMQDSAIARDQARPRFQSQNELLAQPPQEDLPNLATQLDAAKAYISELELRVVQLEAINPNSFFAQRSARDNNLPLATEDNNTKCVIL
jgi:hypothetical protein